MCPQVQFVSVYPRGQEDGLGPLLEELREIKRRLRNLEATNGTQSTGLTQQVKTLVTRMTAAEADINNLDTRVTDLETP
jgi:hypothetical protein